MKLDYSIKETAPCRRLIKIRLPGEPVEKELAEVYREIRKSAGLPGFRRGKVPEDLIRSRFQKDAEEELIRRLVPRAYQEMLKQSELDPLGLPAISEVKHEGGFSFGAEVEVRPQVNAKGYKGLKLNKKKVELKEEMVDASLRDLQERGAQFSEVKDRSFQFGDYIVADIETVVAGKAIEKRKGVILEIKKDFKIPGFMEALLQAKPGETKEVTAVLPEDFFKKEYAGKEALFKIDVKEAKEKKLPELDGDFARKAAGTKNLDELKIFLRSGISRQLEAQVKTDLERQLFEQLLKKNSFELPASAVERRLNYLIEQAKLRFLYQGMPKEKIEEKTEELKKNLAESARQQVRLGFILDKIARLERIEARESDIKKRVEQISRSTNQSVEETRRYLEKNHLFDSLAAEIIEDKTKNFLLREAKILDEAS